MTWPDVPADLQSVELRLPATFRVLCADEAFSDAQIGTIIRCLALDTDRFMTPEIEPAIKYYRKELQRRRIAKLRKAKSRRKREQQGKTPPIVVMSAAQAAQQPKEPQAAQMPSMLAAALNPIAKPKRNKSERSRDDLASDLFSCVCDDEGSTADKARAAAAVANPNTPTVDTRSDAAWIPSKFAMFWDKYPRKVAKSAALKAFTKIIKAQPDVDRFMSKTLASIAYWETQDQWTKDKGKFIPYPASWLNSGHWNDCENNDSPAQATFLRGDTESDMDLIKRMTGG